MPINRRHLIAAAAAIAMPAPLAAATRDLGDARLFRERAQSFLAGLTEEQNAAARFPFGGEVQRRWNFMGAGGFVKPGVRFEEMAAAQKDAGWDLLSAVLSPRGIEKARDVMSLQQVLIDMGSSPGARHPERYSIAVFGEPAPAGAWALRFEGHHLTLTFTVADDRLAGVTPSSFSVNPNRVAGGFRDGLVTLKREDDLARRLAADLKGTGAARAIIAEAPFRNIRATAGREQPFAAPEGIAAAELSSGQSDLLLELIDAYTLEHLASPFAPNLAAAIAAGGPGAHFGFAGSTRVGEPAYYRIHSEALLIEFAAVDDKAQHLHTVFHLA